jgi:hypothetical protein
MSCEFAFVRAIDGDRIQGYLALWGTPDQPDCVGTWFDRDEPPDFGLIDGAPIRLLYEHGQDPEVGKTVIGKVVRTWHDDIGVAFEAVLFSDNPHYRKIRDEIKLGLLGVSSASAEHLAEFDEDGRFRTWLLSEVSLTKRPCEPRMKVLHVELTRDAIPVYRAKLIADDPARRDEMATTRSFEDMGIPPDVDATQLLSSLIERDGVESVVALLKAMVGVDTMPSNMAELAESVAQSAKADASVSEADEAPEDETAEENEDDTETAKPVRPRQKVTADPKAVAQEMLRMVMQQPKERKPVITGVYDRFYDAYTPGQLAFGYQTVQHLVKAGRLESSALRSDFLARLAAKTRSEVARGAYTRLMPPYRANEVVNTGQTGFGLEWMQSLPGTELWEKVYSDARLFNALVERGLNYGEIPRGYNQETILVEGASPTFYVAGEVTDVASNSAIPTPTFATSKFATAKRTLSIKKLGAAVVLSREMQEDTIFDVLTQTYTQLQRKAAEEIEYVLINGDEATAANTNINLIDGTPGSAPTRPSYLLFNGILKLPLVTNTALSYNANNTLSPAVFLELLKRLPAADQIPSDRLLFVMDMDTAIKTMSLAEVQTRDVFSLATLENGMLPFLYKIGVLPSAFMFKGQASDGKRSGTDANNNRGRIALVRADRWAFRYKRQIEVETDRNVYTDSTTVVCFLRCGFTNFSDTTGATAAYNVSVTL